MNGIDKRHMVLDTIKDVLAEQNVALQSVMSSVCKSPKYAKLFPIKTDEELKAWDQSITDANKKEMIKTVITVWGEKGIAKGLTLIFTQKLMLEYNVEGVQNKKRLRDFKNVWDVLFLSYTSSTMDCEEPKTFESELRSALKHIKNRHFKDKCLAKKSSIKVKTEKDADAPTLSQM